MKKFLPFIIFILVFAGVLAGQIGYKYLTKNEKIIVNANESFEFETLFLKSEFQTLDGKILAMSKLEAPVVILNFWASWCLPCLEEMPSMISLKNKFNADKISIVAINTDEDDQRENILKTIKKIKLKDEFIIALDKDFRLANDFKVSAIPVTIFFLRGKVVHISNGPMDFNSEEIIEKMKQWTTD